MSLQVALKPFVADVYRFDLTVPYGHPTILGVPLRLNTESHEASLVLATQGHLPDSKSWHTQQFSPLEDDFEVTNSHLESKEDVASQAPPSPRPSQTASRRRSPYRPSSPKPGDEAQNKAEPHLHTDRNCSPQLSLHRSSPVPPIQGRRKRHRHRPYDRLHKRKVYKLCYHTRWYRSESSKAIFAPPTPPPEITLEAGDLFIHQITGLESQVWFYQAVDDVKQWTPVLVGHERTFNDQPYALSISASGRPSWVMTSTLTKRLTNQGNAKKGVQALGSWPTLSFSENSI